MVRTVIKTTPSDDVADALEFATAHESEVHNDPDVVAPARSAMDRHNNQVGFDFARHRAKSTTTRSRRRVDDKRRKTARQRDELAALGHQLSRILLECAATGELPLKRVRNEVGPRAPARCGRD